jgi:hypothetical protein
MGIPYWSSPFENGSDKTLVCSLLNGVGPDMDHVFVLGGLMVADSNLGNDIVVMVRDTWVGLPSVNNSGVVGEEIQGVLLPCWLVTDLVVSSSKSSSCWWVWDCGCGCGAVGLGGFRGTIDPWKV